MPTLGDMKPLKQPWKPEKNEKYELATVGNAAVKIYRRERTNGDGETRFIYEVADYTAGRRRLRGFGDLTEARKDADRIARQLSTGDATAAQMRNSDAASFGRAMELIRTTGDSLELVAARYAEIVGILGDGALAPVAARFYKARNKQTEAKRVADVVAEMLAVKEARGASARYLQDLRYRLGRFSEAFQKDTCNVTTSEVQAWLDRLKLKPQGYKNFKTVVGTFFEFATARGYASDNPVAAAEKIKVRNGDVEIFTPSEITKLLAGASPDFLPSLAIGAFAGLRSAEVERIEWPDVDLVARHIVVGASRAKTASRRIVPMQDNLAAWLAPYAKRTGKVWPGLHDEFYDQQQATAKAAGVEWKANALRHSYASYRFAQTGDAGRVAGELGNSPAVVHRHYKELVRSSDAVKWFAVAPEAPANVVPMAAEKVRA
jgi:integrase